MMGAQLLLQRRGEASDSPETGSHPRERFIARNHSDCARLGLRLASRGKREPFAPGSRLRLEARDQAFKEARTVLRRKTEDFGFKIVHRRRHCDS